MDDGPRPLVVALVASAGGLEALRELLERLPPDPGFAAIVATHQSPSSPSHLAELLARRSRVEVSIAVDGDVLVANRVLVAPPGKLVAVADHRLRLLDATRSSERPFDQLLGSLAGLREDAVAVILSGTGSDGTLGARRIKDAGGIVIAESPDSAEVRRASVGKPNSSASRR